MDSLDRARYAPTLVHIDPDGWWAKVNGTRTTVNREDFSVPGLAPFDGVVVMIHGTPGEDGRLQAYFDLIGMPYSTGGARSTALTFHKGWTTGLLRSKGLPVASSKEVAKGTRVADLDPEEWLAGIGLPCFVKPNEAGSSIGVHRVETVEEFLPAVEAALAAEDSSVLVEGYLKGREFTVAVIPGEDGGLQPMPVTEIISHNAFFDYDAKYNGQSDEITPADIPNDDAVRMQHLAVEVYRALDCRGLARVDMILMDGIPRVIEVNAVPGFTSASIVPQQAAAIGLSKTELLTRVIEATIGSDLA